MNGYNRDKDLFNINKQKNQFTNTLPTDHPE